jgi:hypothetical protein
MAIWMLALAFFPLEIAGGDHLVDRRAGGVFAAGARLGRAGQPGHDAGLVLLADGAREVEPVDHQQLLVDGRQRRQDGAERDLGLAAAGPPLLQHGAAGDEHGHEPAGRPRGARRPVGLQPGERDGDGPRSAEDRAAGERALGDQHDNLRASA